MEPQLLVRGGPSNGSIWIFWDGPPDAFVFGLKEDADWLSVWHDPIGRFYQLWYRRSRQRRGRETQLNGRMSEAGDVEWRSGHVRVGNKTRLVETTAEVQRMVGRYAGVIDFLLETYWKRLPEGPYVLREAPRRNPASTGRRR